MNQKASTAVMTQMFRGNASGKAGKKKKGKKRGERASSVTNPLGATHTGREKVLLGSSSGHNLAGPRPAGTRTTDRIVTKKIAGRGEGGGI